MVSSSMFSENRHHCSRWSKVSQSSFGRGSSSGKLMVLSSLHSFRSESAELCPSDWWLQNERAFSSYLSHQNHREASGNPCNCSKYCKTWWLCACHPQPLRHEAHSSDLGLAWYWPSNPSWSRAVASPHPSALWLGLANLQNLWAFINLVFSLKSPNDSPRCFFVVLDWTWYHGD